METAITSVATGASLPAPTQAGGSTGTRPISWALLDPTPPMRTGSGLTLRKSLSRTAPNPTVQEYLRTLLAAWTLTNRDTTASESISWKRFEARAQEFACTFLSSYTLTSNSFTGTTALSWKLFDASARDVRRMYWVSPNIVAEYTTGQRIFDAIQALCMSHNRPRDRQIAERLTSLYRAAVEEDESIRPASISRFKEFFLDHPELGLPKITLTPDGTLRARWMQGTGNFIAIEFTGERSAKLVAEIPRDNGLTATHFGSEPLANIVPVAQGMGASFR
jgi:hypothetical protein